MDDKEKYEEALERAKKLHDGFEGYDANRHIIEEIFPELAESEDERIRKELIEFLDEVWHLGKNTNFDRWDKADCADWIAYLEKQKDEAQRQFNLGVQAGREEALYEMEKQKEKQPAEWSKEDKVMLDNIIWGVHMKSIKPLDEMDDKSKYKKYEDFLKSLPERFNLLPKQEWSEEDRFFFDCIVDKIEINRNACGVTMEEIRFLRNLRPQPHWKPSEAQISILAKVFAGCELNTTERDSMVDLFNNLKQMI